ncbi:MAG: SDR family NAD(P)-dependent oxidoreductase [Eubacteriales bacterium]|nr:SDR family NAD(P)-dependent oxidoreductase [Eubacteriales bacterium]
MKILITGAGRGIGFQIAAAMAERGHQVFATYRNCSKQLMELKETYEQVILWEMDVTSEAAVQKAADQVKKTWGTLDGVVSNAGCLPDGDRENQIFDMRPEDLEEMLKVNVIGPARVIRCFSPLMEKGGVFITITSEAGSISNAFCDLPGYSISKAAANKLVSIQHCTTKDYRVLAVHPGRADTDMGYVSAQITPKESAKGICDILTGVKKIPESYGWFINYRGEQMPL